MYAQDVELILIMRKTIKTTLKKDVMRQHEWMVRILDCIGNN